MGVKYIDGPFTTNHFPKDFGAYTGGQDPRDSSKLGMAKGGAVKPSAPMPVMAKAKGGKVKVHKVKMPKVAKPVVGTLDKMPVNRAPANVMARHTPPDMTPPAGGLPYGVQPSKRRGIVANAPMAPDGGISNSAITQMMKGGRAKKR